MPGAWPLPGMRQFEKDRHPIFVGTFDRSAFPLRYLTCLLLPYRVPRTE